MSKSYSSDLRERVVESVEAGASRHEAAERFEVSVVRRSDGMQRFVRSGTRRRNPAGERFAVGSACALVA